MGKWLAVLVDGDPQLEFDHAAAVPQQQLDYLDDMDRRMSGGITLDGEAVSSPDLDACTRFVAQNLASALLQGQEQIAMAMCTWLGVRRPELEQVKITTGELGVTIDLDYQDVYEKPRPEPQVVQFHPRKLDS